jgi:methionyl-tRNA formyltransferase
VSRLVFLGSPEAAVVPLQALVAAGHDVCGVVSQPDKRRGRGNALVPSPVKEAAIELGLPVFDGLAPLADLQAELGVVAAYGRIIPQAVLDFLPMINAHFSLLPRWRGAAPVERAILAGDSHTGVCIMGLEAGLDTGPVLSRRRTAIDHAGREHARALTGRLSEMGAALLVDILAGGVAHLPAGEAQEGEPTYAAKLDPSELELKWSQGASQLERVVRLDRAWTTFRGERLAVGDAAACEAEGHGAESGTIEGQLVHCGEGMLELLEVQPAGKRKMEASAWIRGVHLEPGERLGAT